MAWREVAPDVVSVFCIRLLLKRVSSLSDTNAHSSNEWLWCCFSKMGAQRVSDAVQPTWFENGESLGSGSAGRPFAYTGESEGVQAIYEHTWRWISGQSPAAAPAPVADSVVAMEAQMLQNKNSNEVERTAAAYHLGRAGESGISVLLNSIFAHEREEVRRAACYGLRSALDRCTLTAAAEHAIELLRTAIDGPFVPGNGAVSGTVAWLHALQFAPPSDCLLRCIEGFVLRTLREIEEHTAKCAASGHLKVWEPLLANRYQTDAAIDFTVTDRRRSLTEACSLLSALGTAALLGCGDGDAKQRRALAVRACSVLLKLASIPEPGVCFPSYLGHTAVTGEASNALLRLCSDATHVAASTPATRKVPVDWQNPGPEFNGVRSNVAEALRRLKGLCGPAAVNLGINPEVTKAREQILELLLATSFPWDVSSSEYVPLSSARDAASRSKNAVTSYPRTNE